MFIIYCEKSSIHICEKIRQFRGPILRWDGDFSGHHLQGQVGEIDREQISRRC